MLITAKLLGDGENNVRRENAMKVIFYILTMIGTTVVLASVIPIFQYFYVKYVVRNSLPVTYYFSRELFDTHLTQGPIRVRTSMSREIKTREELDEMWKEELQYNLP
jgi:hypothetical protein